MPWVGQARNAAQVSGGISQPYAFTGREFDAESGLHHYRARTYDPATGRFLSEDPLRFGAGDTNLARYVFNDPVNLIDLSLPNIRFGAANGADRLGAERTGAGQRV